MDPLDAGVDKCDAAEIVAALTSHCTQWMLTSSPPVARKVSHRSSRRQQQYIDSTAVSPCGGAPFHHPSASVQPHTATMSTVTSPAAAHPTQGLPHRVMSTSSNGGTTMYDSDDEFVEVDPNDTAQLLGERLQAWKHACGYLESYVSATEKMQKAHSKEYEKVLKSIPAPLKEAHHFDPAANGIHGFFENVRTNTHGISTLHTETAKAIDGQVMPILKRLHQEIKSKAKELNKGANQGSKSVAKARDHSQKQVEALGQHAASFDSAGGKIDNPANDPYVLHRSIKHRLYKQVIEENSNRSDLIAVQENFGQFEAHVVQTFNQAMTLFLQIVGGQAERQKALYTDIAGKIQSVPTDYEWMQFLHRYGNVMIDPSAPQKKPEEMAFANQEHKATKPLIAGTLERKSRALGGLTGYKSAYYAVSPAKYLHQYEDNVDNGKNEPSPDMSLYLPDCAIGAVKDSRFNVKGKDVSKGKVGNAFQQSHELQFKAHSPQDAQQWWTIICQAAGQGAGNADLPSPGAGSATASPAQNAPPANAISGTEAKTAEAAAEMGTQTGVTKG